MKQGTNFLLSSAHGLLNITAGLVNIVLCAPTGQVYIFKKEQIFNLLWHRKKIQGTQILTFVFGMYNHSNPNIYVLQNFFVH